MTTNHLSIPPFSTLHTLRDWLRWAVSRFNEAKLYFGHGTTNAYDEAAYLILHSLHLPINQLDPFLEAHLTQEEKADLYILLKKRIETRKPAAYLTQEAWIRDFRFYVDERTIVPRSLIAHMLLEEELSFIQPWIDDMSEPPTDILDLCTGSGCIAIILAHLFPEAEVDAIDLSKEAIEVAHKNVADYHLEQRVNVLEGNLFTPIPGKRYDVIISNPPYVTQASMNTLPQEYLHEPAMALGSGEDGMDCIREILRKAQSHLKPEGILVVEVGHNRDLVEEAFPELPFIWFESPANEGFVFLLSAADFNEIKLAH